ncbi:hypothetical protein AA23498_3141 [Acetobacter nitrogenifigens DSM 23921 = NBRC 105050]|uniref:DUF4089 domain-containing protein n=1 Tax=Acetobacter nitrogenifigens TaxID=285268 RepID=UPI000478BC75|nr:DUF4089 domain-containing protein [Acetobacter nitrogenifigens]GBQ98203.1 hypothetical protein AA23498_3141 [Acetobacter nitrogenifigens DSM 23921 = NBRC 105050]
MNDDSGVDELAIMAQAVALPLPDACRPGVEANASVLRGYVALIEGLPLSDHCEPAFGYTP